LKDKSASSSFLTYTLHIFVLFEFAVAQPIFDVLSKGAAFLVARQSKQIDVIFFIIFLTIIMPLFIVVIKAISGLIDRRISKCVHGFTILSLITIFSIQILKKISVLPSFLIISSAFILALASTVAYFRTKLMRFFLTVLSPAIIVFPLLFLFNSPVYKIIEKGNQQAIYPNIDSDTPVIMVIFDEFPTISLMDKNRRIDEIRYPNFAKFTRNAYWFRNHTTVAEHTDAAIPAILTGSYADRPRIPIFDEYPQNIFSLLGGTYEINAIEVVSMLCPEELCGNQERDQTFRERMSSLIMDLSIVYLHIVLPSDMTSVLPPVTMTWGNFLGDHKIPPSKTHDPEYLKQMRVRTNVNRMRLFSEFIESIDASDKPTFHFIHIQLPHVPYDYLPSGKKYSERGLQIPGLDIKRELWGGDDTLVVQGYQRHLLQVGFVDRLLGDLLDHLKAIDMYDRSLVAITADHGVSFWPNKRRRNVKNGRPADILLAPLFIKVPYQKEGFISDRNVQSIDVLPTMADILDIELPWKIDGHSALDLSFPERTEKVIYNPGYKKFVFDPQLKDSLFSLQRKLDLFGTGSTRPEGIYKLREHSDLLDRKVSDFGEIGRAALKIELDNAYLFANVDPDSRFVPTHITGKVLSNSKIIEPIKLAVAVNDRIAAVSRTYRHKEKITMFSFIIPESGFHEGRNNVDVYVVEKTPDEKPILLKTNDRLTVSYSLASGNNLKSSEGKNIPIKPDAMRGYLDGVELKKSHVIVYGWAADVEKSRLPDEIVMFSKEGYFFSGSLNRDRPDVANYFKNKRLERAGFYYIFPKRMIKYISYDDLRVFAVLGDKVASELRYHKDLKSKIN